MRRTKFFLIAAIALGIALLVMPTFADFRHAVRARFTTAMNQVDATLATILFDALHRPPSVFNDRARTSQLSFSLAEFVGPTPSGCELELQLKSDGSVYLNATPIVSAPGDQIDKLCSKLRSLIRRFGGKDVSVSVVPDPDTACKRTAQMIGLCSGLGYENIKLAMAEPALYSGYGPVPDLRCIQLSKPTKQHKPRLRTLTGCIAIHVCSMPGHNAVCFHEGKEHKTPELLLPVLQKLGTQREFDKSATPLEPELARGYVSPPLLGWSSWGKPQRIRHFPLWKNGTGKSDLSIAYVRVMNDCTHGYFWRLTQVIATAGITNMIVETYAPAANVTQEPR